METLPAIQEASLEESRPVGRPLKFATPEILQEKIDAYFTEKEEQERPATVTGLALALDTTRETLMDYQSRDDFADTIRAAKLRCHEYAEEQLYLLKSSRGAEFSLKNNFGWKDKIEHEVTGTVAHINLNFTNDGSD